MSTLYVVGNYITSATLLSISSEDPVYVKEWLYNRRHSKPTRFTAKTGNNFILDLGSQKVCKIAALLNHNLTAAATITIDHNSSNSFPNDPLTVTWKALNAFKLFNITDQFWKLAVDDAGNSANVQIGEAILHTYGAFPHPFWYPYEDPDEYIITDQATPYKQRWKSFLAEQKHYKIDFSGLTTAEKLTLKTDFFDVLYGVRPWFFIPNDAVEEGYFMEAPAIFPNKADWYNYNRFSLELVEQSRGITVL